MKFLEHLIKKHRKRFEKGGMYHRFYYAYEALETFLFVPPLSVPKRGAHIRDAMDMKRMMVTVIMAMLPCLLFGVWNVGHQHALATSRPFDEVEKFLTGFQVVLPIILVSYLTGLLIEFLFATIRRHPVNEGFLVSGMLIPLIYPPTIPLWQVALSTGFAVLVAKEVFGGTGMNIFNVALMARAFLYFAFPSDISGDGVWVYLGGHEVVDGYSGATALAIAASTVGHAEAPAVLALYDSAWHEGLYDFWQLFLGMIPGSIGETSTLMCLIGAAVLIFTGVGSWKIIISVFTGAYVMGLLMNLIGGNEFMLLPPHYHWVLGGLAFGAVYMATDPVTAAHTERGKWIYGFLIGIFTVVIRILNPAYPEGIMLAILLMNIFSSLLDYFIVQANKKRRLKRATV